jgi:hypothetical protein
MRAAGKAASASEEATAHDGSPQSELCVLCDSFFGHGATLSVQIGIIKITS